MSERIRQLEEALQALQSQLSPNKHPLLQQELLSIKKSPELFGVDHPTTSYGASGIDRLRRDDDFPHSERHESGPSSRDGFDDVSYQIRSARTESDVLHEVICRTSRRLVRFPPM